MRSPACKSTISPTTISPIGSETIIPLRRTRHWIFPASSCSLAKADSLPYSDSVDTKVARKIAIAMPSDSNQSKWRNRKITFTASAASSTLMIGSPKLDKNCRKNPRFLRRVSVLAPFSRRDASTSTGFNPFCLSVIDVTPASLLRMLVLTTLYSEKVDNMRPRGQAAGEEKQE